MRIRSTMLALALGTLLLVPTQAALAGNPCGMPDRWPTEPSAAVTTEVEMDWCAFLPTVAHVEPGNTVTFRNLSRGMPHTVTGVGGGMLGWEQRTDETLTWTAPNESGVYPYACVLHPGMVGAIVVGDADAGSVGASDVVPVNVPAQEVADADSRLGAAGWVVLVAALVALAVVTGRRAGRDPH